jgi:hypothetical protein
MHRDEESMIPPHRHRVPPPWSSDTAWTGLLFLLDPFQRKSPHYLRLGLNPLSRVGGLDKCKEGVKHQTARNIVTVVNELEDVGNVSLVSMKKTSV